MPIPPDIQAELDRIETDLESLQKEIVPFDSNQPQRVDPITNNVTEGGTKNLIQNYTDLSTYANDAETIRNNQYQLARALSSVIQALRTLGIAK